jgi:hypothetical protein
VRPDFFSIRLPNQKSYRRAKKDDSQGDSMAWSKLLRVGTLAVQVLDHG